MNLRKFGEQYCLFSAKVEFENSTQRNTFSKEILRMQLPNIFDCITGYIKNWGFIVYIGQFN